MIINILAIFIGGGIGAVFRYIVTVLSRQLFTTSILGTLGVNLAGCFCIGFVFGIILDKIDVISPVFRLFITVGFLGGLTTFSTLNFEVFELIKSGKIAFGIIYLVSSCILGLLLTFYGYALGAKI